QRTHILSTPRRYVCPRSKVIAGPHCAPVFWCGVFFAWRNPVQEISSRIFYRLRWKERSTRLLNFFVLRHLELGGSCYNHRGEDVLPLLPHGMRLGVWIFSELANKRQGPSTLPVCFPGRIPTGFRHTAQDCLLAIPASEIALRA